MRSQPKVAFNDFRNTDFTGEIAAVRRVLDSGWLVLGEEVRRFERAWAERCGVERAVGVGNGLDAIEIGLRATGIGPGDEIVTTPMTAVATVLGILRAGATPVLADIDPTTGLLDPTSAERCISKKTKGVLLVHLYGHMRDLDNWVSLCDSSGIKLFEDCAQAHDSQFEGQTAGAWGAFGAYSYYPTKNLGAAGDAGALITHDADLAERAASLRNYGQSNRYEHPITGLNSRLDEVQAAILNERLPRLTGWTERRREIASTYREQIDNPAVTLMTAPSAPEHHVNHLFVVTTESRGALQAHLAEAGIESLSHYPIPVHQQKPFTSLTRDAVGLEHAEAHADRCLSLPCAPHLSNLDVERVVESVNAFIAQ